jgi:predicted site-specific integrase-resolvase
MPEESKKLTTKEFADRTGLSAATVSQYIRDGKIDGKKESGRWMIPDSQLARFQKGQAGSAEAEAGDKAAEPASGSEKRKDAPVETSAGKKAYSVEEFSRLTFLTPSGVRKYLKEGILKGFQDADGQWRVNVENLQNERIRHLVR